MTTLQIRENDSVCAPENVSEHKFVTTLFDCSVVRSALKSWHDLQKLGENPLTGLAIVAERMGKGGSQSRIECGTALREVLRDAIEALRPHRGDPDYLDRAWHPYLMLSRQYIARRSPEDLAGEMCLGRREYYRRQTHALDLLGSVLLKMEQEAAQHIETAPQKRQVPFMAPLRPPHTLIGRTRFVNAIKRRLFSTGPEAFCAIHGLPGVGKTALAIELANDTQVLAHFSDGVLWAGLGRQPDMFALLGVWGIALGLSGNELAQLSDVTRRAQAVHAAIGLRRMLLVIDDAWQLEMALAFKLGGPHCAHLLTTRMPEIAQAFAGGDALLAPELRVDDSLTLLQHIAPAAVKTNPDEVRQLAQAAGGLPLALTLIGEHLRKASQGGSPQRLQRALEQLAPTPTRMHIAHPQSPLEQHPDLPPGVPLSLQAVIGVSDDALDAAARDAIRALAVFPPKPNSFSEAAALAVSAVSPETLDTLIDHGLLTVGDLGAMMLHQTISDYMRLKLAESPEAQRTVHARMAVYYASFVEAHQEDYSALEVEWSNIQRALDLAFADDIVPALIQTVMALQVFFLDRGVVEQARKHLNRALQMARQQKDTQTIIALMHNLGSMAMQHGMYTQALEFYQKSLELAEANDDWPHVGAALRGLGSAWFYLGDNVQAKETLLRGLSIVRAIHDRLSEGKILNNLGGLYLNMDQPDRAVEFLQQALAIAREGGNRRSETVTLNNLGVSYMSLGQMEKSSEYYRQALALARKTNERWGEGTALRGLGSVQRTLGQFEVALDYYRQGLCIQQETSDRRGESVTFGYMGEIYSTLGQLERAVEYLERALIIAREICVPRCEEEWLGHLGHVYYKLQQMDRAGECYQQALALVRDLNNRQHTEEWLVGLAQVHLAQGQLEQARACYEQARDSAQQAGDHEHEREWQAALDAIAA
ncbi:MAG: tetratricopeptide repeat protein [Anaerolineae bacterium]|nr:tetratricopeptide repeat protein [Anaerolineae bacterium]